MQFFTGLTTLILATMAFGAVIESRSENSGLDMNNAAESSACSPKGGACVDGALACCEGLTCFMPPKSPYEPEGVWDSQGACI